MMVLDSQTSMAAGAALTAVSDADLEAWAVAVWSPSNASAGAILFAQFAGTRMSQVDALDTGLSMALL